MAPSALLLRVNAVDDLGEILHNSGTLELERRGEVTVLLREIRINNLELADRLGARDRGVGFVNDLLDLGDDLLVRNGFGKRHRPEPLVFEPPGEHFAVESHDCGHERLLVAKNDALANDGALANRVLELGR